MFLTYLVPFLKSQALKTFCEQHNKRNIAEIHTSFANMDRFRAMIHKQRLLYFPEGRDIYGVLFEYHTKHQNQPDVSKRIATLLETGFTNKSRPIFRLSFTKMRSGMSFVSTKNRPKFLQNFLF